MSDFEKTSSVDICDVLEVKEGENGDFERF